MVPAERALEGEAIDRPLVLRVQGQLHRVRVHVVRVGILGDRQRKSAQERVPQVLIVDVDFAVVPPVVALVPELHVVRTGHVRGRRVPGRATRPVVQPALRAVHHRRDQARHDGLCEVQHLHQVPSRVRVELASAPLVVSGADPCFEKQLIGQRRRPACLLDVLRAELAVAVGFGRRREDEVWRARERRRARTLAADRLFIPHERELVAPRRLPGDARRVVLPRAIRKRRRAEIGHVGPRVRVARVLVVVHVQRVLPLSLLADAHVVPEPVLDDGPADRHVDVVHVEHRSRLRGAARLQLVGEVVCLHPLRETGDEGHARHLIPALPRDDVHGEAGRLGLAQTTRRDHRHFLRVADVGDEVRRLVAAGRVADVQPVDRQTRFDAAPAVDREDREDRAGVDVVVVRLQPGNGGEQVTVAADARQVSHRFVVERHFTFGTHHIHDW